MRDMHHRHQHAIVAHFGQASAGGGATMDGDVFAHQGASTDFGAGRLAFVFQVLRRQPDRAEWKQRRARPDHRVPIDHDVGDQFGAVLDHHIRPNSAKRADFHPYPELRPGGDDSKRVDLHGGQ